MNTVEVRCNLCGADDYKIIYDSTLKSTLPTVKDYTSTVNRYGLFNRIVSCNKCGLVYMNPRDSGVKDLYRGVVDETYLDSRKERELTFRKQLKVLGRFAKEGGSLLDVGCYAGIFPKEAIKAGFKVTGIEASRWAAQRARAISRAEILTGSWDEVNLPEESFDLVTMWDVVEHLEDPSACFKQIHKWLKKDGVLAVTTHDIHSIFAKLMGKRYPWLMRFHLYHFDPKTLTAMLAANGFERLALKFYTKTFSLKYMLNHAGIPVRGRFFETTNISINTGDLFMIIAGKR